jgi:hypothetical protein
MARRKVRRVSYVEQEGEGVEFRADTDSAAYEMMKYGRVPEMEWEEVSEEETDFHEVEFEKLLIVQCRVCRGTGHLYREDECMRCKGTGWLDVEAPDPVM